MSVLKINMILLLACCLQVACVPEPTESNAPQAMLNVHVHQLYGRQQILADKVYTDSVDQRKISFNFSYFYLSNFVLQKTDNTLLKINKVLLIGNKEESFALGNIPAGKYKALYFHIGLDSVTNHSDISKYDSSNPLASQKEIMHWSWSNGYIFLKAEGLIYPSNVGADTAITPFAYHIATDPFFTQLSFPDFNMDLAAGSTKELLLEMDYQALFKGIDIKNNAQTHTFDNILLANTIWANLPKAFKAE